MKTALVLAVLAIATQAYSQCIPSCATGIAPAFIPNGPAVVAAPAPALVAAPAPAYVAAPAPTVVTTNSVASNLADTLSLLTVTTLLAETLPYGYPAVAAAPIAYPGLGCNGYGYVL